MRQVKVLVVGQGRARSQPKNSKAWSAGPSARRLFKWLGVKDRAEFCERFDAFNVLSGPAEPKKKGDAVPARKGEVAKLSGKLWRKIMRGEYNRIVLVGKFAFRVALPGAFIPPAPFAMRYGGRHFVCVTHPSGVNVSANGIDEINEMFLKAAL